MVELKNKIRVVEKKTKKNMAGTSISTLLKSPFEETSYKQHEVLNKLPRVLMVFEKANPINSFLSSYCEKSQGANSEELFEEFSEICSNEESLMGIDLPLFDSKESPPPVKMIGK